MYIFSKFLKILVEIWFCFTSINFVCTTYVLFLTSFIIYRLLLAFYWPKRNVWLKTSFSSWFLSYWRMYIGWLGKHVLIKHFASERNQWLILLVRFVCISLLVYFFIFHCSLFFYFPGKIIIYIIKGFMHFDLLCMYTNVYVFVDLSMNY